MRVGCPACRYAHAGYSLNAFVTVSTNSRMVAQTCVKQVPQTICEMQTINCVKKVPYTVCHQVPVTTTRCVPAPRSGGKRASQRWLDGTASTHGFFVSVLRA